MDKLRKILKAAQMLQLAFYDDDNVTINIDTHNNTSVFSGMRYHSFDIWLRHDGDTMLYEFSPYDSDAEIDGMLADLRWHARHAAKAEKEMMPA